MANVNTRQFNSALSAHVVKETAPLLAEIDRLKKEVERLGRQNTVLCTDCGTIHTGWCPVCKPGK